MPKPLGIHPGCGGDVIIKDWRQVATRGYRYEVYCQRCKSRDPNGYPSRTRAVVGGKEYFRIAADQHK